MEMYNFVGHFLVYNLVDQQILQPDSNARCKTQRPLPLNQCAKELSRGSFFMAYIDHFTAMRAKKF